MTRNLVSCPLAALLSTGALESLLGSFVSSQQKGKESARYGGLEVAHLATTTHIPLARTQSHGHIKLQGKLGNVVCAAAISSLARKMPLFCSPLGLDLALGKSRG